MGETAKPKQNVISPSRTGRARQTLRAFIDQIHATPDIIICFGLYCAYTWAAFFGLTLQAPFDLAFVSFSWIIPSCGVALAFLAIAILCKGFKIIPQGKKYMSAWLAASLAGTCCVIAACTWQTPVLTALYVPAALLIGLASACIHLEFARLFGAFGAKRALIISILGILVAACIIPLLSVLPRIASQAYVLAVPIVLCPLLSRRLEPCMYRLDKHGILRVPWKLAITVLLQGLSFGIMQAFSLLGGSSNMNASAMAICFGIAAVLMLVTALFFKMDFDHLFYQVGLPIMALGYAPAIMLGSVGATAGGLIHSVGYRYVSIIVWVLCAYLVHQKDIPVNWLFPWAVFPLMLGEVAGTLAGEAWIGAMPNTTPAASALSVIVIFLLLYGSLLMSDRRNLYAGWGALQPGEDIPATGALDACCNAIGREVGLTSREAEVFALLARGHNRTQISHRLILSPETVKAHMRSVYGKLNVHSQQELIARVEERAVSFETDRGEALPVVAF